jgi:hypothetical protein
MIFRLIAVLCTGLFGYLLGAFAGFFLAVVINPDASPTYMFWGGLVGAVALLWFNRCFGDLFRGLFWALAGALLGWLLGLIIGRFWHSSGVDMPYWGAVLGSLIMALSPPRLGRTGGAMGIRRRNEMRSTQREQGTQVSVSSGVQLPEPPPYRSDGKLLGIEQMQTELKKVAPTIDFGLAKSKDGAIPAEVVFFAADFDYINGEFFDYVSRRMQAEGIRKWTEAKFDCDDFALYLNQCATMCMMNSGLKGATHSLFQATVRIGDGEQVLGVPDGYHANNVVRCTDGCWYFIEPQAALNPDNSYGRPLMRATRRFAPSGIAARMQSSSAPNGWMCPLPEALDGADVTLMQAKF